ncbi:MAG: alanine--tRNA ligase [bacterium]|nr:alanine--tRNA ligase [bacterium]
MSADELRKQFLIFFKSRGHTIVPSSSLIPDDPSVLLTTAGMQQFKKYYTGEADPVRDFGSKNTASIQKSFRTSDIDEVGDDSHLTFFEMLGNFSFGGYFKKEAIEYAKEFIESLGLEIDYVTVFEGDEKTPFDEESFLVWQSLGVKDIRKAEREDNFWGPTGKEGPCGPTTEIYINGVEVWNIVFNEYYCRADGVLEKLGTHGVDTGMGLERLAMVSQGKKNIFETDLFAPFFETLPAQLPERQKRIIIDHLRGTSFLLADGVRPSNKEAGYILRRLIRRVLVYENIYKIPAHVFDAILHDIIHEYGEFYPELLKENETIREEFKKEREKFDPLILSGIREFKRRLALQKTSAKHPYITFEQIASDVIILHQSFGFSPELTRDLLKEHGYNIDEVEFKKRIDEEFRKHQEISRAGQEKKFGGHGLLLDTGELKAGDEEELKIVTRLHTATHLLNAALHKVLGEGVEQRGSDITAERTRFDFLFPRKLTPEELQKIEALVNYAIEKKFSVTVQELPLEEAKKSGALFFYKGHYPESVKVYTVGNGEETFSRELCGGPHVLSTGEIGKFKIIKEEASSAGVRRIRAVVT